ncbi:Hypothetical protein NTJ_10146 [Nesidiocoris tenuis]|uniref:Uncharacterized protein n=1 Tax=Nesidiocoris tenuis TaxID=355587 RepID=A0ABN7AYV5_9HEMI|nr:Hypothetical protein NTJ_10146 [Nesidiocoris tenuis]
MEEAPGEWLVVVVVTVTLVVGLVALSGTMQWPTQPLLTFSKLLNGSFDFFVRTSLFSAINDLLADRLIVS